MANTKLKASLVDTSVNLLLINQKAYFTLFFAETHNNYLILVTKLKSNFFFRNEKLLKKIHTFVA